MDEIIKDYNQLSEIEKTWVADWIKNNFIETKTVCKSHTSYGLKHIFEDSVNGFYIHNDAFKYAMLLNGFKPYDEQSVNWHFYISKKSPAFKIKKKIFE